MPAPREVKTQLRAPPFALNDAPRAVLAELDRHVLGAERWIDYTMWLTQPDLTGYCFADGERAIGYAYVSTAGGVAQLVVTDAAFMQPALSLCIRRLQANGAHEAAFKIPFEHPCERRLSAHARLSAA